MERWGGKSGESEGQWDPRKEGRGITAAISESTVRVSHPGSGPDADLGLGGPGWLFLTGFQAPVMLVVHGPHFMSPECRQPG